MRNTIFAATVLTLMTSPLAYAQTADGDVHMHSKPEYAPMIDSQGSGAIPALPVEVMSNGTISYINGGIGDEEIAEFKSKQHEFNVHLLITAKNGEFISDATMKVVDSAGTAVLSLEAAGPYLYIHLPAGSYTLESTSRTGETKDVKIKAPASGSTKYHFAFTEDGGVTTEHTPTATVD